VLLVLLLCIVENGSVLSDCSRYCGRVSVLLVSLLCIVMEIRSVLSDCSRYCGRVSVWLSLVPVDDQ
jgi:hypothetical protein